ncbi:MAG TPA: sigma-70 family RNA polymerase sigma factor [Thermoanaerobaculia bacterium]|nr:sigma-70 family RNA polymerase sigma factor [Thermoanaerobaculia bacterium]
MLLGNGFRGVREDEAGGDDVLHVFWRCEHYTAEADFGLLARLRRAMTFEEFYKKEWPLLMSIARRRGLRLEDAEDLVQEIFMQLAKKPEINDTHAYLAGATYKACSSYWRQQGRPLPPSPELGERHDETRVIVREVLGRLPPRERAALWLRHAEQYTVVEVAILIGYSVGGTEKLLRRAKRRAAALLEEGDETERRRVGHPARRTDNNGCPCTRPRHRATVSACAQLRRGGDRMIGSATDRPLAFVLALGFLGGAALITVQWTSTRGPLVLFPYAALVIVTALYLRLEHVQGWTRRFTLTLGAFMLATILLYVFIGVVHARSLSSIPAWGHLWRLGLMLVLGCALSAAVAQLTATKPATAT